MGGRGANRNRKNGQIEPKVYYSTGYMDVLHNNTPVKVKMIEADTSKSGGAQGMPSWSNSPNSIYATTDKNKGTVERIRLFDENCKAFADLEYHPIETGGEPKTHWHAIDFNKSKDKKKKTGRSLEHHEITDAEREKYGNLLSLLGKKPNEIEGYHERK